MRSEGGGIRSKEMRKEESGEGVGSGGVAL